MVKIIIDYSKRKDDSDKTCVKTCPFSVFQNREQRKPIAINEEKCILCRICQVDCPEQAIEILS